MNRTNKVRGSQEAAIVNLPSVTLLSDAATLMKKRFEQGHHPHRAGMPMVGRPRQVAPCASVSVGASGRGSTTTVRFVA